MFIDSTIKICPKCASHPTETTNIFWMTTALQNTHRRHIISSPPKLFFLFLEASAGDAVMGMATIIQFRDKTGLATNTN